jgi:exonuclease III
MRLGTWNVNILHNRSDSFITAARELERHKLDFVCVQEFVGGQSGHGYRRGYILVRKWKGNNQF